MTQCLHSINETLMARNYSFSEFRAKTLFVIPSRKSCSCRGYHVRLRRKGATMCSSPGAATVMVNNVKRSSFKKGATDCEDGFVDVQTLRQFSKEELSGKTVLIRFDSSIILETGPKRHSVSVSIAISTIKYLHEAAAKLILISSWNAKGDSNFLSVESVAEHLSSLLHLQVTPTNRICLQSDFQILDNGGVLLMENLSSVKADLANDKMLARGLSSGVDMFVNDCFSSAHKMLASTVGVTRYCGTSVAGFHFEQRLNQLKKLVDCSMNPCVAIIGGGNLVKKAVALRFLASRCSSLVFVGRMAFQLMHALGMSVPLNLVEHGALSEAKALIQYAEERSISIVLPTDFLCQNTSSPDFKEVFATSSFLDGWEPVDLGPHSLDAIGSVLSHYQQIIWIGPAKFRTSTCRTDATSKLVFILDELSQKNCEITVIGTMAAEAVVRSSNSSLGYQTIESASAVWEFLKRRNLPGIMSLDRAYSSVIEWNVIYCDPTEPLVVDIGCGNGLFLMEMASKRRNLNFLGLEINKKLVRRCLDAVCQSELNNVYFIATNATSTFRSIVSSYPGPLVLVAIQCPNPDFNEPDHRWRMVQKSLTEAIADLLGPGGKVFLQSDVHAVAVRMRDQFLNDGKGKLYLMQDKDDDDARFGPDGWIKVNPFGIQSDWERHVLDRGAPMYRLMLLKEPGAVYFAKNVYHNTSMDQ